MPLTAKDYRDNTALLTRHFAQGDLIALLETWLRALNQTDVDAEDVAAQRTSIDDAEGAQLEDLRALLLADPGDGDAATRLNIRAAVLVRRSSGTADDLMQILDVLHDDQDPPAALDEVFPAEVAVGPIFETTEVLAEATARNLRRAKAAGLRLDVAWSEFPEDEVFTLSSQLGVTENDADTGFGISTDPNVGGRLVGIA